MPEDEPTGAETDDVPAQEEGEEEPTGPTHDPFPFKVWTTVTSNQTSNGLRHHDHLRYRQYCTRRLRRLFCNLKFKHGKNRFKGAEWPKDFQDMRFLEVPLVRAERAWSYGMQLKADNATLSELNCRWRHHGIRRFTKAVKWAQMLEEECKKHGDQRSQLEAEAYVSFLEGTLFHEREEWSEALEKLTKCRRTCEHLGLASGPEEGPIFKAKAQEISPLIRECKYNLGVAYDDDGDGNSGGVASPGAAEDVSGLNYRGHGLVVSSDKIKRELNKCVGLVNEVKVGPVGEENNTVIERYGQVSAEFGDALRDIHHDMIASGAEGQTVEWRMLEAFARELSICMNIERNIVLLRNHMAKFDGLEELATQETRRTCRVEEGIRFCDMLKDDIEGLKELPETSDGLSETLGAYSLLVRNCRCLFLALVFSTVGKPLESMSLMDMLRNRVDEEEGEIGGELPEPMRRVQPLFEEVHGGLPARVASWRCRGMAELCAEAKKRPKDGSAPAPQKPKEELAALGTFPPEFRDITCKPLLFDLAFPAIVAPDIEEMLGSRKNADQKGLAGRVAGGLGRVAGGLGGLGGRLGGFLGRK